jgi:hypothetical protein
MYARWFNEAERCFFRGDPFRVERLKRAAKHSTTLVGHSRSFVLDDRL